MSDWLYNVYFYFEKWLRGKWIKKERGKTENGKKKKYFSHLLLIGYNFLEA